MKSQISWRTIFVLIYTWLQLPIKHFIRLIKLIQGNSKRCPLTSRRMERFTGFSPDHVFDQTLKSSTIMIPSVEKEAREIMRDHLSSRTYPSWLPRNNDTLCNGTFFTSIPRLHVLEYVGLQVGFGRRQIDEASSAWQSIHHRKLTHANECCMLHGADCRMLVASRFKM